MADALKIVGMILLSIVGIAFTGACYLFMAVTMDDTEVEIVFGTIIPAALFLLFLWLRAKAVMEAAQNRQETQEHQAEMDTRARAIERGREQEAALEANKERIRRLEALNDAAERRVAVAEAHMAGLGVTVAGGRNVQGRAA